MFKYIEEINISPEDLSDKEDSLKSEDNIAKDQISELEAEQLEEIEIKNDVSITITKKSKSNFFWFF